MKFVGDKNNASNAVSFSNETVYTAASGLALKEKINSKDEITIEASKKDVFLKVTEPCLCALHTCASLAWQRSRHANTPQSRQSVCIFARKAKRACLATPAVLQTTCIYKAALSARAFRRLQGTKVTGEAKLTTKGGFQGSTFKADYKKGNAVFDAKYSGSLNVGSSFEFNQFALGVQAAFKSVVCL